MYVNVYMRTRVPTFSYYTVASQSHRTKLHVVVNTSQNSMSHASNGSLDAVVVCARRQRPTTNNNNGKRTKNRHE